MYDLSILFVEDTKSIRDAYLKTIKRFFTTVYIAQDGQEAYDLYLEYSPDIILSDITMPRLNGIELSKLIRENDQKTKLILLTALYDKETLLEAIPLNLIEYLVKPVGLKDLQKVFERCYKEISNLDKQKITINKTFVYDYEKKLLVENSKEIKLTKNEISLIEFFLDNRNRVFSSEEIFDSVWDDYDYSMTKLRSLINRLHKKTTIKLFESSYGIGYKLIV